MTETPVKCSNCDGRGRIRQFICQSAYPLTDGSRRPIFFDVICTYCGGNGWLHPRSKKALKAGRRD